MTDGRLLFAKYISSTSTLILEEPETQKVVSKYSSLHSFHSINRENFSEEFCTLYCIPGQKYTIGKNFTSRDNQGEFIFCYFPEVGEECEIHIKQDRTWWIKSQEGNSIYLNGEKLTKKVQLHFGDYVSFGINYSVVDDIVSFIERTGTRNSGKIPIFLFERSNFLHLTKSNQPVLTPCRENEPHPDASNPGSTLGRNEHLISKILTYLPISTLKSARLVCKLWYEEATPLLRDKSLIHFNFNTYQTTRESMRILKYTYEMEHFPHPHWYLNLPVLSNSANPLTRKFRQDFTHLLKHQRNVESLRINGAIHSPQDLSIRMKLFQAVSQTLQDLQILGDWGFANLNFPHIAFPHLKSVTIAFEILRREENNDKKDKIDPHPGESRLEEWCTSFMDVLSSTNLQSMGFACSKMLSLLFLEELAQLSCEDVAKFSHLQKLMMLHTTPSVSRCCLTLPQQLTKLELNWIYPRKTRDHFNLRVFTDFENLIEKNAQSLNNLQFILPMLRKRSEIHIPVLERLKYLIISSEGDSKTWQEKNCNTFCPKISFCDGAHRSLLVYNKFLPRLQSLRLDIKQHYKNSARRDQEFKKCSHLFKTFLVPGERSVENNFTPCKTLRELHVPYEEIRSILQITSVEIEKMFPNVAKFD